MLKRIIVVLCILMISITQVFAASSLQKEIVRDSKSFDGKVGIYAKNLNSGKDFTYKQDDVFPTASTSKLMVALAVYKYLYPQADNNKQSIYDRDVEYMMTVSDNAAFYELLDELEKYNAAALEKTTTDLKLRKTKIHSDDAFAKYHYHSVTTPYEMAKVFETIYNEKYLGKEKSKQLKLNLANTIFHDEIPRYMLCTVMHKVGELDDILCDVGIVDDGNNQILISVYTISPQGSNYASDFIANISAKLYNQLRKK